MIMVFSIAHWETLEMIVMRFSMKGETSIEHVNAKCHVCAT